jgi:hypothetical protein
MADIKISALPSVSSLATTDIFPTVASSTTSKISVENLANSLPIVPSASYATTASSAIFAASALTASYINNLNQNVVISGSLLMSGSIIPNVGDGSYTSSYDLGSPTAAWRDLYIANGTIYFTDPANNQKATLAVVSGSLVNSGSGQINSGSTLIHKTVVGTLSADTREFYDPTGEFGNRKQLPEGYESYYLYVGHQVSDTSVVELYSIRQGTGASKTPKGSITTSPIRIYHMGGWPNVTIKPASQDTSSISLTYGPTTTTTASFTIVSGSYVDLLVRTPSPLRANVLNWVIVSTGSLYGW